MEMNDDWLYGRTALREGKPWIVPEAFEFLKSIVDPAWYVFEWGAGGSTVWFARNCTYVYSVEHNPKWHDDIQGKLGSLLHAKASIALMRRQSEMEDVDAFRPYADMILHCVDERFDMVFVDGEPSCRERCLTNSFDKIKPGGWLLLDNSDWYKGEYPELETWKRFDFVAKDLKWIGQPGMFDLHTSFWRKPG